MDSGQMWGFSPRAGSSSASVIHSQHAQEQRLVPQIFPKGSTSSDMVDFGRQKLDHEV